jgi:hypothetical protein
VEFWSATGMFGTYAGQNSDLTPWLAHAEINRDRNLRLQYLAGMASNLYQEGSIYEEILQYRRYPAELFDGADESINALRESLERSKSEP